MEKNFSWPVRVYYEDTDSGGVVYYANYLKFFERARTEYLRAMGFEQNDLKQREGIIFAVKSIKVDYLKPARFNDALLVSADIAEVKRASLVFNQAIVRRGENGPRLCDASVRIVCLDADGLHPRPLPDYLLRRIKHDA